MTTRIFKTKDFERLASKENVTDEQLLKAARRLFAGKIDARLGAHLVKQRVSQGSGGRSGGHRSIIVYREGNWLLFLHLFGKQEKANLTKSETEVFRKAAKLFNGFGEEDIKTLLSGRKWIEIDDVE